MITMLKSWFKPSAITDDYQKLDIKRWINLMIYASFIYIPIILLGNMLGGRTPILVQYSNVIYLMAILLVRRFFLAGKIRLASVMLLVTALLIITINAALLGTIRTPVSSMYLLTVVAAGTIFGVPGAIWTTVYASLSILGLILAQNAGLLPEPNYSVSITQWVAFSGMFTFAGYLTVESLKIYQKSIDRSRDELAERKRTEQALKVSESRYRLISENTADVISVFNFESKAFTFISPSAKNIIGYSATELLNIPYRQFLKPEFIQIIQTALATTLPTFQADHNNNVFTVEFDVLHKDGHPVYIEAVTSFVLNEDGEIEIISISRDISERQKTEEALRESEDRYRRAISAANAVPYTFNYVQNRYTFIGEGIEKISGYTREDLTQQMLSTSIQESIMIGELSHLSNQAAVLQILAGQEAAKATFQCDFRILDKNGESRWLSDTAVQVLGPDGIPLSSIGILEDVTARKKIEMDLRESRDKLSSANIALEKAMRVKDEFLASMSHELRTPLTGILGISEALQFPAHGKLTKKQRESLQDIEKSGHHLLELINDILDLSRIEAGNLEMEFEPCLAAEVCQASLQLVKGLAHKKKQTLAFSMEPASITLRADQRHLKQMLVNLLSNAIKFTPEGGNLGLEVRCNFREKNVFFTVWDEGIGIRPEDIGKLFQPFVQLDSSLARQYAGTGLGLALVERTAELHGGSIKVESVPGAGSRFTIALPWSALVTRPLPNLMNHSLDSIKTILTIEDIGLDASRITHYLIDLGIMNVIQPVLTGALEKAADLQPSIILLDLSLPDGDGMDLLAQLKADERTRNIQIIIISGEERRSEALKLGASAYLLKPYLKEDLLAVLKKVAVFLPTPAPESKTETVSSAPLVLIADDDDLILRTVTDFLIALGLQAFPVHSGFELLERAPEIKPDLMLVDIQMPGMDGLETMRRLRAHNDQRLAATPIIAVTALAMPGDQERCIQAGANEYLSKPVSLRKLVEQINRLLEEKGGQP